MSFIQSGSETRICRISSDDKFNGIYGDQLSQHNSWTSFDDDRGKFLSNFLMYVYIAGIDIYIWLPKIVYKIHQAFKTKSTH